MPLERIKMGSDLIFDVQVIDVDGRILEKWKCMRKDYPKVCKILNNKYGLKMKISDVNEEKDLSWI